MSGNQFFHGLQFDNDPSVDDDVCVIISDQHSLIADLERDLLFHGYSALGEFVCECFLINGFRETMAEFIHVHPCLISTVAVSTPTIFGRLRIP